MARWVAEWRNAAPEVHVRLHGDLREARVLGSEPSWRAALRVALDNARQAGARRVDVTIDATAVGVEVGVEDDGRGVDGEAAWRAGEPSWRRTTVAKSNNEVIRP